jgi:hypothetical protein
MLSGVSAALCLVPPVNTPCDSSHQVLEGVTFRKFGGQKMKVPLSLPLLSPLTAATKCWEGVTIKTFRQRQRGEHTVVNP